MKKVLSIMCLVYVLSSCHSLDTKYIKENWWQCDRGYKIGKGDFLIFNKNGNMYISNDTIYTGKIPRIIIVKLNKKKCELYLRPIDKDSIGIYVNSDILKN